jgi:hypothetical protein
MVFEAKVKGVATSHHSIIPKKIVLSSTKDEKMRRLLILDIRRNIFFLFVCLILRTN